MAGRAGLGVALPSPRGKDEDEIGACPDTSCSDGVGASLMALSDGPGAGEMDCENAFPAPKTTRRIRLWKAARRFPFDFSNPRCCKVWPMFVLQSFLVLYF